MKSWYKNVQTVGSKVLNISHGRYVQIFKFAEDVFMIEHKYIRLEYTIPNTFKFSNL